MPATRIETRKGWLGARRFEFLEAIHRALQVGFKIPKNNRDIRLIELDHDAMMVGPDKGASCMVIEIALLTGRSLEAKRRLYSAIVDELAAFNVPASDVKIILIEHGKDNLGVSGVPASSVDLGYEIEV